MSDLKDKSQKAPQFQIIHPSNLTYPMYYRKITEKKNSGQSLKQSFQNLWKIRNKPIRKPFGNLSNYLEDNTNRAPLSVKLKFL